MKNNETNPNATPALRMLCCLVVVYEHLITVADLPLPHLLEGKLLEIAVDCFFVLSGYWIIRSLKNSRSTGDFFKRRCQHILPLYWLTIAGTVVAVAFAGTLPLQTYFTSPALAQYLGANLLFLNFLHSDLPGFLNGEAVNGSLWTLKVEWAFYFLLPLLFWLRQRRAGEDPQKKRRFWALLFLISAVLTLLIYGLSVRYDLPNNVNYQIQRGMLFFTCGIFWEETEGQKFPREGLLLVLALAAAAFCVWRWGLWAQILFAPALTVLCRAFAERARPFFFYPHAWDISYPVYLIHLPIIQILRSRGIFAEFPRIAVLLTWGFTLSIALCLHLLQRRLFLPKTLENAKINQFTSSGEK